jgi:glycosyltransferase involved in cell wall biosynthesis
MKVFFSIIIPIFNKEKYIDNTINSVLKQLSTNFEIILIDDFSSDSSYKVAEKYSKSKYMNFIRIYKNKKNMGVSFTRNRGIALSRGNYLIFLDADDEFSNPNLLINLHKLINTYNSDYIILTRNYFGKINSPDFSRLETFTTKLDEGFYSILDKYQFAIRSFPFGGSASAVISKKIIGNIIQACQVIEQTHKKDKRTDT